MGEEEPLVRSFPAPFCVANAQPIHSTLHHTQSRLKKTLHNPRTSSTMKAIHLTVGLLAHATTVSCFTQIHTRQISSLHRSAYSSTLSSTVSEVAEEVTLAGPPAITARDLTCSFDGGDSYQLNSASYVLPRGARVGLVGRNGW